MDSPYNNTEFTLDQNAHKNFMEGNSHPASAMKPQTAGGQIENDHIGTGWALDPFMGYVALEESTVHMLCQAGGNSKHMSFCTKTLIDQQTNGRPGTQLRNCLFVQTTTLVQLSELGAMHAATTTLKVWLRTLWYLLTLRLQLSKVPMTRTIQTRSLGKAFHLTMIQSL